jgi:cellobiose phosphorylase
MAGTISRFGEFIEAGACFRAHTTPHRPWMNVFHNDYGILPEDLEFHALVSQYGDGPVQFRSHEGRHVQVSDFESEALYVRDDADNSTFCPCGSPVPTEVEQLVVDYRAASTEISSKHKGITVRQRVFVPRKLPVKVCTVFLTNEGASPRTLSVFSYAKFNLGGGPTVDVEPQLRGVFAWRYDCRHEDTLPRAFLCLCQDSHYVAATGHREDFLEPSLSYAVPRLLKGADLGNVSASQFLSMGAVQARVALDPGQSARLDFLLGHASSLGEACELRVKLQPTQIDALLAEVEERENRQARAYSVDTGHSNLDALFNHFIKKQHHSYLTIKSGFRDNLQVAMAIDMADEKLAEAAILQALSHQYAAGWAPHHFRPLSHKQCSDEPAWILMAVPWHIKQTGNLDLLWKEIPFIDSSKATTIWDHLLRAMRWLINDTGKHGLCNLRDGDWNDGLSPRDGTGGRESVMVSEQLCHGLLEVAELAERINEANIAQEARRCHADFAERLNQVAWDGDWFLRVLCEDGHALGSHTSEEGRIFMNAQSWAVLGQVAPRERLVRAMDSVEKHLKLDIGYRVVNPPYTRFDPHVGGSSTVFPGCIENGSSYNHAGGFKAVADCLLGRAELAWDTLLKVAPDNPENPIERSCMEPFAFSNMFFADRYNYGRTLYAWNTGTGAWFALLMVEYILGVRRDYDGLRIDPCLTRRVPMARVTRQFRGASYEFEIDNTAGRCTGVTSILVDGRPLEGNLVPDLREGSHTVKVVI